MYSDYFKREPGPRALRIEILKFEGCPNTSIARDRVMDALVLESATADVEEIEVATVERAQKTGFLGSPSVRVNDKDAEPRADSCGDPFCTGPAEAMSTRRRSLEQ